MASLQRYVEDMASASERIFGKFCLSMLKSTGRQLDGFFRLVREIMLSMKEDWSIPSEGERRKERVPRGDERRCEGVQEEMKEDAEEFQLEIKDEIKVLQEQMCRSFSSNNDANAVVLS